MPIITTINLSQPNLVLGVQDGCPFWGDYLVDVLVGAIRHVHFKLGRVVILGLDMLDKQLGLWFLDKEDDVAFGDVPNYLVGRGWAEPNTDLDKFTDQSVLLNLKYLPLQLPTCREYLCNLLCFALLVDGWSYGLLEFLNQKLLL